MPKLRCRQAELNVLAGRYEYDTFNLGKLRPKVLSQGFLTKDDLRVAAKWKSPRSAIHIEKNTDTYVKEISKFALSTKEKRTRIEVLTLLNGVQWPTASVILHFFHRSRYPIIDFRALWTVSMEVPDQYSFDYWWQYLGYCRALAKKSKLSMRELDQALWQFSKENQEPV